MYANPQFELIKNNKERLAAVELDAIIVKIDAYLSEFNRDYHSYTANYISVVTGIFNTLNIDGLISLQYGGKNPGAEDVTKIIDAMSKYLEKLGAVEYLSFLREESKHVVFVGANGCGKTTLLRHLIQLTGDQNISYYQADRLLLVNMSYSPERDMTAFKKTINSTYKEATNIDSGDQGYHVNRQLNQIISLFEKTRASELEHILEGSLSKEESITSFILNTWNALIKTRELYCDGTLKVRPLGANEYDIKYLSSGEKSVFYFLASILLQPEKKYYFIDEPENNLNPSIITQLWNIIEMRRPNSIFIYLTHNSEFVSGRISAKIYWIKSFDGSDWDYEILSEDETLPLDLMVSLVGNKQPVLFCESEDSKKYDAIVFKLMFPGYKVISAGGCSKVIAKVKAYKQTNLPQTAYGIIDCDYREENFLNGQKKHNIFHFPFFEIENFLFCEEILVEMISRFSKDKINTLGNVVAAVKADFIKTKETFIIRNTATRLHEIGFGGKIKSLRTRQELIDSYNNFSSSVSLTDYFNHYEQVFDTAANSNDLNTMLRYFDSKNILSDYDHILDFEYGKTYLGEVFMFLKSESSTLVPMLKQKFLPDMQ